LQNSDGDRAIEMALKDHENYVMKPQREGGGALFFKDGKKVKNQHNTTF